MKILFVTAEYGSLAKVGGLADATAGLAGALTAAGHDVRVAMPAYGSIPRADDAPVVARLDGIPVRALPAAQPNLQVLLVGVPGLARHAADPYAIPDGATATDDAAAWSRFCRVAAWLAGGRGDDGWRADVVHAHDWPAALVPVWLMLDRIPVPTVFTVHNLAHRGGFPPETLAAAGLPDWLNHYSALEFHGEVALIKGGLVFADRVTTVSPSYANEVRTPAFGAGLDGLLRERKDLIGIVNGIAADQWDPRRDPALPAAFGPGQLAGKRACRTALLAELGLPAGDGPVAAFVGRLQAQKGLDVLLGALPRLLALDAKLVFLGSGDPAIEAALSAAATAHPEAVRTAIQHDDGAARRIFAGSDLFLMPSHFEPCGLTQMYAMRYGSIPVAHAVGGLRDTITDGETGFLYEPNDAEGLATAFERAVTVFRRPRVWNGMVRRAMGPRHDWREVVDGYLQVYADAVRGG